MAEKLSLNRLVKLGISLVVFVCTAFWDLVLRALGRGRAKCVILYYHSVPAEQQARFVAQLEIIQRLAQPIDVSGSVDLNRDGKYVGITFDDAFENYATVALPELLKRKIPSTVFVIADALGKMFGPLGRPLRVMSEDQVRALPGDLVKIGSHTRTHPYLPSLPQAEARFEIASSRAQLQEKFGRGGALFSFPFGGFNQDLVRTCREAGYERIFTTLPYLAFEQPDEFVVGRVRVDPTDSPIEFRLKLSGAYRWLPLAFSLKRRLMAHRVMGLFLGRNNAAVRNSGRLAIIQE